jgi:cholesterol oxidase
MRRLSKPITELQHDYEIVVVGSGYGASIAASRMARCGRKVCLLEKGKEFLPGEFPSTLPEAMSEMQFTKGKTHFGSHNGLYEFVAGDDINVFKGCGLGGTSLVNANVSIEPEDRVFQDEHWPVEVRNALPALKEGMAHAREMLRPNPYPEGKRGYPTLEKTTGMKKSAASMGETFRLLDINVTFEDQRNASGVYQKACNNCGDCVTGCNHSSKNTTQMTYLPDAHNHGAEIYTEVGVRYIERAGNKWVIWFEIYGVGREKFNAPDLFITADMIFLGAGAIGSTEILLRSAQKGLSLSGMLGKRFTGNGDVLGFGYNNDSPVHGVGLGDRIKGVANVGPCITSVIDMRNRPNLEDGMTLEEGSVPGPIGSILVSSLLPLSRLLSKNADTGFVDFLRGKWRELKSLLSGPYRGAIDNTQIYLVMTHDDGNGSMSLQHDNPSISWPDVGKQKIFNKVSGKLKDATTALGGTFVVNPTWTALLNYDLVTVHPLGGCVMGDDATRGVVDHKGQVFANASGKELHPGLFVMDGSIIPRPLGTNPLLTISGLAERNAKIIATANGWPLHYDFSPVSEEEAPKTVGIEFTETMKGFFSTSEKQDYAKAFEQGKAQSSPFEFTLTIQSQDVDRFVKDPEHEAGMAGTVKAPGLSASPLTISAGRFNLFVPEPSASYKKKMKYEMKLHSKEGQTFFFKGYKDVQDNKGIDLWKDTTVLYITVYEGDNDQSPVKGMGILKIEPEDLAIQVTTMKAVHATKNIDKLHAISAFGKLFAGALWDTYFASKLKEIFHPN